MKNSILCRLILPAIALGFVTQGAAQVSVSTLGTQTITFDGDYANVIRFAPPLTATDSVRLAEPNTWSAIGETGRFSFISTGVAGQWPGTPSFSNPFTADIDNNGSDTNTFSNFQVVPIGSPAGGAGNFALQFNSNTWADKGYVFKIDNNTGGTVSDWNVTLDTWFNDTGLNAATLRLGYATTYSNFQDSGGALSLGTTFTQLDTRTGTNTNSGLSALDSIGGGFSASVASGQSLYIAVLYDQNSAGTEFYIDNLSITAVPEPSTWAMLMGGVFVLAVLRRCRAESSSGR